MDRYMIVVLVFLMGGMGIAITKSPPVLPMFYTMLAGAVGIILYSAIKARKSIQRQRRRDGAKKRRGG